MDADQLKAAGFTDREIKLHQAGFSDDEIKAATAPKKPMSIAQNIGRAAYNLPMDTAETLKGAMQQFGPEGLPAQAIMHPVKTAGAVGDFAHHAADILTGGLQRVREMSAPEFQGDAPKMDTKAYDKFASDNYDKYGTPQRISSTVADHPAGTLVAAASVLDPALKLGGIDVGKGMSAGLDAASSAIKARVPPPRVPPPTVKDLKASAGDLYDRAQKAGVVINGQSYANFADDARELMNREGIDPDLHPKTTAALKRITNTGGDVTLNQMETLRKITGDATEATAPADKRLARMLQDHLDDYTENLQPQNIIAGDAPKAVALLKQARTTWKDAARGQTIDNLIAKVHNSTDFFNNNLDANYRAQFKKLADNDRGMARFTPEQQNAIRKVAYGDGPVQTILHTVGRIIPNSSTGMLTTSGAAAAAHLAGAPLTGGMAVGVGAIGGLSKVGSTLMTSRNATRAAEMARSGSKITPRSEAYYQIQQRRAARKMTGL